MAKKEHVQMKTRLNQSLLKSSTKFNHTSSAKVRLLLSLNLKAVSLAQIEKLKDL